MMLVMATAAQPLSATMQARGTVRIIKPVIVAEKQWRAAQRRTDRLVREEDGRMLRLRTIHLE